MRLIKYVKEVSYIIISIIMSQLLCYYFLDSLFEKFNLLSSNISLILLRISIAIILYILIKIILRKKILKKDIDILFISYCILVVNITLFKEYGLLDTIYYNFNIFDLAISMGSINSVVMAIGNIAAYIPIGIYIIYRFKNINKFKYMIFFVMYIIILELVQCVLMLGAFDINDIILNSIGFYIGISFKLYNRNIKEIKEVIIYNIAPIMLFLNICFLFIMIYSINMDLYQNFIIYMHRNN